MALIRGFVLLVVLGTHLAGCMNTHDGPTSEETIVSLPAFKDPVAVSTDFPGAEPVIAIASDGTLYVEGIGAHEGQNVNKVFRSDDDGATWTDITPPFEGESRSNDGFVAVGNDDTVYAANVFSLTFQVFRSDDRGDTWTKLALPTMPALMHRHWIVPIGESDVHVVIEALPPTFAPWIVGGPTPTDTPGHPNEGLWYLSSQDKGTTWSTPRQIDPQINFAGQGNLVVSADGSQLYVPRYEEDRHAFEQTYEEGHWYLMASEDGGDTWERREMFPLTSELASAVMPLVLDTNGTLYFAWTQEDAGTSRNFYAHSADGGKTWSERRALAPHSGTNGTQAMPWITTRGPGSLGALWYAADTHAPAAVVDVPWFVEYARIEGADSASPQARTLRVTETPVHHGNVCAKGPACEGQEDRSLLDYLWLVNGPDGRDHGVFASTEWDRPSAYAVYVGEKRVDTA